MEETNQSKFVKACRNGDFELVKSLTEMEDVDIHFDDEAGFRYACEYGYNQIVEFIYLKGGVDVNAKHDYAFRMVSSNMKKPDTPVSRNHFLLMCWLYSLGGIDVNRCIDHADLCDLSEVKSFLTIAGEGDQREPLEIEVDTMIEMGMCKPRTWFISNRQTVNIC